MSTDWTVDGFVSELASKAPTPGGGGASALVGAVGAALGEMVGNLTVGKKKYADVEPEVYEIMGKLEALHLELLDLIEKDAVAFKPLAKAYSIPKEDPTRAEVMENALRVACSVPMDIMRTVAKVIDHLVRLAEIGSALAISDVGCGAVCCKAAIKGASLNVFINTKSMADRAYAAALEKEADELLTTYCALADKTYDMVIGKIR